MSKVKIELEKEYKNFKYLVVGYLGYRCGYVRIPPGHRLYGLSYSEQIPVKFKELAGEKIGKRGIISFFCSGNLKPDDNVSMDLLFDVHGGITFSGKFDKNVKKKDWWIGFDCAHDGDAKDFDLMDKKQKDFYKDFNFNDGIVRKTEYVEKECKRLIDQIIKWFSKK